MEAPLENDSGRRPGRQFESRVRQTFDRANAARRQLGREQGPAIFAAEAAIRRIGAFAELDDIELLRIAIEHADAMVHRTGAVESPLDIERESVTRRFAGKLLDPPLAGAAIGVDPEQALCLDD